ncbi:AIPR family protein [soil metagenome]
MRDEIPDGLPQLRAHLRTTFAGVVLEAITGQTDEEKERNFLSRALAAYAIHMLSGCTLTEAASSVVDSGGDGGIDAIYYAKQTTGTLWVIQSKFVAKGRGEPDGLGKFRDGLEALLEGDLHYFEGNAYWRKLIPTIEAMINDSQPLQIRAVFVYSSINTINTNNLIPFQKLRERFSRNNEYFLYSSYNLVSIVDWMIDAKHTLNLPEVKLTLHYPGELNTPYETIYGLIKLRDIMALYREYGKRMVVANIRAYQGDTDVNTEIFMTLRDEPEMFLYLNNGLTAYCERMQITHADRGRVEYKRIIAKGFSVINGAQTLGAIGKLLEQTLKQEPEGYVFLKLISLEHCVNDIEFAKRITRTANYQNRIDVQHFIAQQPYQEEIARKLQLSGITYHFRADVDTPTSDEYNFNLQEAMTALACLDQNNNCDFVARLIANRRSLLSLDVIDPDHPLYRTRYDKVFHLDRSARAIWRAVQTQVIVIDKMKDSARASTGVRKSFFETARWLVLNLIFLQLKPEQGDELALTTAEIVKIGDNTIECAELLWNVCESLGVVSRQVGGLGYEQPRHFRTVFSNATDCSRLRAATLAQLNRKNNGGQ